MGAAVGLEKSNVKEIEKIIIKNIDSALKEKRKQDKKWTKKYFAVVILKKSEAWLYNKLSGRRQIGFRDLEEIAQGLGILQSDLFPLALRFDIENIPLTEIIKMIARQEIEKYLIENNYIDKKEG